MYNIKIRFVFILLSIKISPEQINEYSKVRIQFNAEVNYEIEQEQILKIFPQAHQDSSKIQPPQTNKKYYQNTNMLPHSRSFNNSAMKEYFDTPQKNNKNTLNYELKTKNCQKQKSTSFYISPNSTRSQSDMNNQLFLHFNQRQRSSTPKFHPSSPAQLKNRSIQVKPFKNETGFNQKLFDSKHSEFSVIQKQIEKSKSQLSNTKREDGKNKIKKFQSLRSTITTSSSNLLLLQLAGISRKTNVSGSQTPISEIARQRIFSMQQNSQNYRHSHLLEPSQISNLGGSESNQSLDKNMKNINFHKQTKKIPYINFLQKKNNQSPVISQELKQNIRQNFKTVNNAVIDKKKQAKFPSFLTSRFEKKELKNDQKIKSRQFPKIFPSNLNCTLNKEQHKTSQNKVLTSSKHAKSFSVFETIGGTKKRNSQNIELSPPSGSFNFTQSFTPKGSCVARQKSNTFHDSKIQISQTLQSESKNSLLMLGNKGKSMSASLRQSLDKLPSKIKISKDCQFFNLKNGKSTDDVEQSKIEKISMQKPFFINLNKNLGNSKINQNRLFNQKSFTSRDQQSSLARRKNRSSIDDIKQTLISCNLFSQEDYKGVFESHKKDILNSNNFKKNESVKFQIQPQRKTSLKALIDFSDTDEARLSSEEERKLVQLAEMCEQKRSKWILEQTDTIRQSLKELSEFNTQKSLYDNEWTRISNKDFSTARNYNRTICQHIDQIREEENSQIKQQSKLSSIRVISESSNDQYCKETSIDHGVRFMKGKMKSFDSYILDGQEEDRGQSYSGISLDDFDIRWCSEEFLNGTNLSQQNQKTFIIYGARHRQTNLLYTIKKFQKSILKQMGDSFISSFIKNLKIQMLTINHPNVEKVYTIFNDKNSIYLVFQFTQNKLSNILYQNNKGKFFDSSDQCISSPNMINNENNRAILFKEIIDGLEQIHLNHIVHKGIQPNVIKTIFDTCKISGFNDSQLIDQPVSNVCNSYICPQILFDSSRLAMDIWCLGILAYELLIGKKPFNEQNDNTTKKARKILQCNFDIPLEKAPLCEEILSSALRRNPKDRASIFQIKNIWARKLKEISESQVKLQQSPCKELMRILSQ